MEALKTEIFTNLMTFFYAFYNKFWEELMAYLPFTTHWLRDGHLRGQSWIPGRENIFLLSMSSRLILGPTQPPIRWVTGVIFPGVKQLWRVTNHPVT
jgi:hypothetical protein